MHGRAGGAYLRGTRGGHTAAHAARVHTAPAMPVHCWSDRPHAATHNLTRRTRPRRSTIVTTTSSADATRAVQNEWYGGARGLNMAQLPRAVEAGNNPGIFGDLAKMISAGSPPLDCLQVAFTAKTDQEPERAPTNLSRMIAFGLVDAAKINPKLAPINHYAKSHGGKYLGRIISDKLVATGNADAKQYVNLDLQSLMIALQSDNWRKHLDLYNHLLVPLQRHGPCGARMGVKVANIAADRVYTDVTLNGQLPMLLRAILKGVGLPYEGRNSLPELIAEMNSFISFQGGGGEQRMNTILDAAAKYVNGLLGEASANLNLTRDPSNLEAPPLTTLLDDTGNTQGCRFDWADFCTLTIKANEMQRQLTLMKPVPEMVEAEGLQRFAYKPNAGEADGKRERDGEGGGHPKNSKSRRALAAEKSANANSHGNGRGGGGDRGGGGAAGGGRGGGGTQSGKEAGKGREQPDYSGASVKFSDQGKVIEVGPTSEGKITRYDAVGIRKMLAEKGHEGACLAHLVTKGLNQCKDGCLHQGHPDHQPGGPAHTYPAGFSLRAFNLNKSAGKGKGDGRGKGSAGKGGAKGGRTAHKNGKGDDAQTAAGSQ